MDDLRTFSVNNLTALSTDPAHLFMQLYDLLPDHLFLDRTVPTWLADPEIRRRAARVERAVLGRGRADVERLAHIVEYSGHRGAFTVLRGLDNALWYVNPFNPAYAQGRLAWLASRYAQTGLLNDPKVTTGALLPRCTYPGSPRGRGRKEDFFCVHRVPAEGLTTKIEYKLIENRHQPRFDPEQEIKIACAPFLADFTELRITFSRSSPSATYRLAPADQASSADRSAMAERITTIIDAMDSAGARIGVLPEGCLSDTLLKQWRTIARATAAKEKPLRWLLLGSGPLDGGQPPVNRAVLIDRWTGDTLLIHDKLERFTIDAAQASTWRLPDAPDVERIEEDISCGSTVAVRESALGRFAVLICQDLYSSTGWERELNSAGISHLFIPIFSKPILRYRWEQQAAERQVAELGAWVVVSNSLAVANATNAPASGRWYTCLVIGPADPDRDRYGHRLQYGRARTVNDIGWTTRTRRRTLPTVLAGGVRESWFDK